MAQEWNKDPFYVSPQVQILDDPTFDIDDDSFRVCSMKNDSENHQYSLRRLLGDYFKLVKFYYLSRDTTLLRIFQMNSAPTNDQFYCVTENQEYKIDEWMKQYPPGKHKDYDMNRFLYPLKSLIQSIILVLGMQNKGMHAKPEIDFDIDVSEVFVVGRPKGRFNIVVGFVKILPRKGGSLKCLSGVAGIIEQWYKAHGLVGDRIPHEMRSFMRLLRTWDGSKIKVGTKEFSALEMLKRHPVFFQNNMKAWFDFIVKFKPLYLQHEDPQEMGVGLETAFKELGYQVDKKTTKWYNEVKAIQPIKDFEKKGKARGLGMRNTLGALIRDIRNFAVHYPGSNDRGDHWMRAYRNIETMLEGTSCSIHLCCIRSGLSDRFEEI